MPQFEIAQIDGLLRLISFDNKRPFWSDFKPLRAPYLGALDLLNLKKARGIVVQNGAAHIVYVDKISPFGIVIARMNRLRGCAGF